MSTVSVPVSELSGLALDWAVANCWGVKVYNDYGKRLLTFAEDKIWRPSGSWSQGGPIIEREGLHTRKSGCEWQCDRWNDSTVNFDTNYGPTLLIAAMRCYVASKIGSVVEVPSALV